MHTWTLTSTPALRTVIGFAASAGTARAELLAATRAVILAESMPQRYTLRCDAHLVAILGTALHADGHLDHATAEQILRQITDQPATPPA